MKKYLGLLILTSLISLSSFADVILLSQGDKIDISKSIYYKYSSQENINSVDFSDAQKNEGDVYLKYNSLPAFIKITIKNDLPYKKKINLVFFSSNTGVINGQGLSQNQEVNVLTGSDVLEENASTYPFVDFTLEPEELIEFKLKRIGRMQYHGKIYLMDDASLTEWNYMHIIIISIYIGAALIIIFYNSLFLFASREKYLVFYLIYLVLYILASLSLQNFFYSISFFPFGFSFEKEIYLFTVGSSIGILMFWESLLVSNSQKNKKFRIINRISMSLFLILLLIETFFREMISYQVGEIIDAVILLNLIYVYIGTIIRLKEGSTIAYFFIASFSLNFFAILGWFSYYFELMELNFFTRYCLLMGGLAEFMVFSLLIAYKYNEKLQKSIKLYTVEEQKEYFKNKVRIIAHDLLNSVFLVKNYLEQKEHIKALEQVQNLEEIINNTRSNSKDIETKVSKVLVRDAIASLEELFRDSLYKKKASFLVNSANNYSILSNKYEFTHNLLGNIVSNSIKFSDLGKSIIFDVYEEDNNLNIEVTNHGSEFDKFVLESNSAVNPGTGTLGEVGLGQGLLIVKYLVSEMGFSLDVRTEKNNENFVNSFILKVPGKYYESK